jgi:hypothetical protein
MTVKKVLKNEIPKLINKNIINIHLDKNGIKHGLKQIKKKKESNRQRRQRNSSRAFPNNVVATNKPQQLDLSTATIREREGIIGNAIENNKLKREILLLENSKDEPKTALIKKERDRFNFIVPKVDHIPLNTQYSYNSDVSTKSNPPIRVREISSRMGTEKFSGPIPNINKKGETDDQLSKRLKINEIARNKRQARNALGMPFRSPIKTRSKDTIQSPHKSYEDHLKTVNEGKDEFIKNNRSDENFMNIFKPPDIINNNVEAKNDIHEPAIKKGKAKPKEKH